MAVARPQNAGPAAVMAGRTQRAFFWVYRANRFHSAPVLQPLAVIRKEFICS